MRDDGALVCTPWPFHSHQTGHDGPLTMLSTPVFVCCIPRVEDLSHSNCQTNRLVCRCYLIKLQISCAHQRPDAHSPTRDVCNVSSALCHLPSNSLPSREMADAMQNKKTEETLLEKLSLPSEESLFEKWNKGLHSLHSPIVNKTSAREKMCGLQHDPTSRGQFHLWFEIPAPGESFCLESPSILDR